MRKAIVWAGLLVPLPLLLAGAAWIAAGPSLEQHYQLLQQSRARQVPPLLICVDTAVKALLAHQIVPDIVVTVDYLISARHLPVAELPASFGSVMSLQ